MAAMVMPRPGNDEQIDRSVTMIDQSINMTEVPSQLSRPKVGSQGNREADLAKNRRVSMLAREVLSLG